MRVFSIPLPARASPLPEEILLLVGNARSGFTETETVGAARIYPAQWEPLFFDGGKARATVKQRLEEPFLAEVKPPSRSFLPTYRRRHLAFPTRLLSLDSPLVSYKSKVPSRRRSRREKESARELPPTIFVMFRLERLESPQLNIAGRTFIRG